MNVRKTIQKRQGRPLPAASRLIVSGIFFSALACNQMPWNIEETHSKDALPYADVRSVSGPTDAGAGLSLADVTPYANCGDLGSALKSALTTQLAINWNWSVYSYNRRITDGRNYGKAARSAPSDVARAPMVGTHLQVSGVDEADDIKISDQAIFIVNNQAPLTGQNVAIMGLNPMTFKGKLELGALSGIQLYMVDNTLVVTGSKSGSQPDGTYGTVFHVLTFDVTSLDQPRLLNDAAFTGQIAASRLVDGKLVLVLNDGFAIKQNLPAPSAAELRAGHRWIWF